MRILLEHFTKRFGSLTVIDDMNLEVKDGEMLALLGPSGCGKSTTLFAVCGIHRVSGGRILFGERDVTRIPPQSRNVGVVFQSFALYPHMTVGQNIAFPLEIKKLPKAEIEARVVEMAELVHIGNLLERRPSELSGGQQQRVALARALVRKPDVLLLDEPLANLDAKLRLEMRSEVRRIQLETGITAILVTHDQVEAMSMCDRIAIMNEGKIIQVDTPEKMYDSPRTEFVAGFLGNPPLTYLRGTRTGSGFALANSDLQIPLERANLPAPGSPLSLGIRPENYGPHGDVSIPGRVSFIESQGREILYDVTLPEGSVLRSIQAVNRDVSVGDQVAWAANGEKILVFGADGDRL